MRFDVIGYSEKFLAHQCRDENGHEYYVDLGIDHGYEGKHPREYIGTFVSVGRTQPYILLAGGVVFQGGEEEA